MRDKWWGMAVTLFALCIQLLIAARDPYARSPQGDGYYAWLFARSIVYDGDIDFKNDYQLCGDPWSIGVDRGTGHPNNNFSFGHALFWIPVLELTRILVPIPASAPPQIRGSCKGPRVAVVLYSSPIIGALTIFLMYLIARRFARDGAAALAAGLIGLAGTNLAYAAWMVSYSHIYASFAVALLVWSTLRAIEKTEDTVHTANENHDLRAWALVAFAIALSMLQRPTEIVFAPLPFALVLRAFFSKSLNRRKFVAIVALLSVGVMLGALPSLLVNRYLFGSALAVPQGRYFLFFAHAHPWLVLFAPRGGLFYSAPTAWLGVLGCAMALRGRRWRFFFAVLLMGAALEIYIASSALDWHESWGFGARRLSTLSPFLVAGAAVFLESLRRWFSRRRARAGVALGAGVLASMTLLTFGVVDASAHNVIVPDFGHAQADYYGTGDRWVWNVLDKNVGDLAILPAEILFSLRYHLPPTSFRDATEPFAYARIQRGDMHFTADSFPLGDARMKNITEGFIQENGVLRLTSPHGRIVFAAEWPFATSFVVAVGAGDVTHLRLGIGHAFSRVVWLASSIEESNAVERTITFTLPNGEVDSGINEIIVDNDGGGPLAISSFRIRDETAYPPAF